MSVSLYNLTITAAKLGTKIYILTESNIWKESLEKFNMYELDHICAILSKLWLIFKLSAYI